MKRILAFIFCVMITLSLAGCLSTEAPPTPTAGDLDVSGDIKASGEAEPTDALPDDTKAPNDETIIEEQIIFEKDGIRITAKGLDAGGLLGTDVKLLIENDTDIDITVQTRDSVINGIMIDSSISCNVAARKKANDKIGFYEWELKTAGIDKIKDIEFKFHIFDSKSWDTIIDSEQIVLKTNVDASYIQKYDDSGSLALDRDGIKIVAKRLDNTESLLGADIYVYVENNTAKDITIQLRDTSINGFMIDPIFSCDVLAGKKAFDSIAFLDSYLKDNGIIAFEELECTFHVFDKNTWDGIFDSDIITISFNK